MAEIKIHLSKDEQQECETLMEFIQMLSKEQKHFLQGLLNGVKLVQ